MFLKTSPLFFGQSTKMEHLSGFPILWHQPVAWGDMDAFQHVSNIVYFRYLQDARVDCFEKLGWWQYHARFGIGPIVHSIQARYRRAVTFPDQLIIGTAITDLTEDRFKLKQRIVSQKTNEITTESETIIVCFDYRNQQKCPFPESIREAILKFTS